MDVIEVPPRPDPDTGEPRPPRAPADLHYARRGHSWERLTMRRPAAPEGGGPALEWHHADWLTRLGGSGVVGFAIVCWQTYMTGHIGWIHSAWPWLMLLVWPPMALAAGGGPRIAAGADWLRYRSSVVWVYEVVRIEGSADGTADMLLLADARGGEARVPVAELQHRSDLWDLVFNGLRHSIHRGDAAVDARAREILRLDE